MKTALLLSGGMDSASLAWMLRPDVAYTVNYGQRAAEAEIRASSRMCRDLQIEHFVLRTDCGALGSGDMSGQEAVALAPESDWWPFRNQLLATVVAMDAIKRDVSRLVIGSVLGDGAHMDGTAGFVQRLSDLIHFQEGAMVVEAPALEMTTVELIQQSGVPAWFLALAHSCHRSDVPCGRCRGCNKYLQVYDQLGYELSKLS